MHIRKAELSDTKEIFNMYKRLASEHEKASGIPVLRYMRKAFGPEEEIENENSMSFIECLIKDDNHLLMVYEDDGEVQGVIHVYKERSKFINGYDLHIAYLVSNKERKGIGSALIGMAKSILPKLNAEGIILEVMHFNTNALRLYNKLGFIQVGSDGLRYTLRWNKEVK